MTTETLSSGTRPAALLRDLLISVTTSFATRSAFTALESHIRHLFHGKTESDTVRVWVPACATGEEAYSIGVLKHAAAKVVSVERRPAELVAIVEDDGVGFDPELLSQPSTHIGLTGMRERAAIAGGQLTIESRPGAGTTVRVKLPLR